jgi:hypothetical protein
MANDNATSTSVFALPVASHTIDPAKNRQPDSQARDLSQGESRIAVAFYAAVERGHVNEAEELIGEFGRCATRAGKLVDVRRVNREGEFPLLVASSHGDTDMVSQLSPLKFQQ